MEIPKPQYDQVCVTINTDASFCPIKKVGSYAFIIRSNKFNLRRSGILKANVSNSSEAERMAILNAMHCLTKVNISSKLLVINTDSEITIRHYNRNKELGSSKIKRIIKRREKPSLGFNLVLAKRRLQRLGKIKEFSLRHVKAHSGVGDARSYNNRWCDKQAKMRLEQARNNFSKG